MKMHRSFEIWKSNVVNYRLKSCCLLAPLRAGILFIGYFNVLMSMVLIAGTASNSLSPIVAQVQMSLFEETSPTTAVLVPATELMVSVVLLCAVHRRDPPLLRLYMWCGAAQAAMTVLRYSIVVSQLSALQNIAIVAGLLYQGFIIFLVRSYIVELKLQAVRDKNGTALGETTIRYYTDVENVEIREEMTGVPADVEERGVTETETVHEVPKLTTIQENAKETSVVTKGVGTTAKSSAIAKESGTNVKETSKTMEGSSTKVKETSTTIKGSDAKVKEAGTVSGTANVEVIKEHNVTKDAAAKASTSATKDDVTTVTVEKGIVVSAAESGVTAKDGDVSEERGAAAKGTDPPTQDKAKKVRIRFWK